MIRRLAWTMMGVLGVVFVGLSAVYLYFRYDNYAMLRDLIRRQAQASLGGDLALNGPVDIEVGDDTRIFLRNITLTNPDPGFLRSIIAIDEARIAVPTAKAVGRDFSGAEIDLYGVRVEIARDGADASTAPPTDLEAAAAARGIDLPAFEHIRAHDVELALKGLWGDGARALGFSLVTLERKEGGGFSARMEGAPNGLNTQVAIEAAPLGDATPGASWRLRAAFGGSDIDMLAELRAVRRLFVRIGIDARHIDAADVAALFGPALATAHDAKPLLRADDRIPAAWLDIVDASLHLAVERLQWGDAAAGALNMQARLERGRLVLAPASVKLGEGGIDASARLDMAALPATLDWSMRLERAAISVVPRMLGIAGNWQGTLDGNIAAAAKGDSLGDLLNWAGNISVRVREGVVDDAIHGIAGHDSIARLFHPDQPTKVPCLAVEASVAAGRLTVGNATLVTALGRLAADGFVDWRQDMVDLKLITAPDAGPERSATRHSHVSGALLAPDWQEEILERRWLAVARPAAACVVAAVAPR